MNQSIQSRENSQTSQPMILHEGDHSILDGLEDMDDIFGIHEDEANQMHDTEERKTKQIEETKVTKKKIKTKQCLNRTKQ